MVIKNIHEKLLESIQTLLVDTKINLPFYGNFNLFINFSEKNNISTCGVNMTPKGMNFYYSSEFLNKLSQKEVNFVTLHEDFHLLWDHPKRTITGNFDHKLSNIAQDMIINHIIWQDISKDFVEIPKDDKGRNMALFVPKEYDGNLIFEELYEWLRDKQDELKSKKNKSCKSCGGTGEKQESEGSGQNQSDQQGEQGQEKGEGNGKGKQDCPDCEGSGNEDNNSGYGPYGKDPNSEDKTIDTYSVEKILEDLDKNQGQYLDVHMGDEIPEEMRDSIIRDTVDRLRARGFSSGNIEETLNKLRKKRKDYLKEIKRSITNQIFGTTKIKSITRPNRRGIFGVKGCKKTKNVINVILDTSGSMGNTFERVLSYIYRSDVDVNMIQGDTQVKWVEKFMNQRKLDRMKISGLGGTVLQPSVNYVVDNFNNYNTCILTDGFCDDLDLSGLKGKVLLISIGQKIPISKSNGKVKQIMVDIGDK